MSKLTIKDFTDVVELGKAEREAKIGGFGVGPGYVRRKLVIGAFKGGYKAGTAIDDKLGLSDSIAGTNKVDMDQVLESAKNGGRTAA